jgi:hypothetical protein
LHASASEQPQHLIGDECGTASDQKTFGLTPITFLFILLFLSSPWFSCLAFKNLKVSFHLFFLQIWSLLVSLLVVLFGIIYNIWVFFQFHSRSIFFHHSNFIYIIFIIICFIWDNVLNWFCFAISSFLSFISYQIWSSFFLLLFIFIISLFNIKLVGN